jgi:transcriptional regulator with XRE-family HTH domain
MSASVAKKKTENWPEVLKAWRERRGITQKEAADRLGVAMRTYQGWEGGEQNPIFKSPSQAVEILT